MILITTVSVSYWPLEQGRAVDQVLYGGTALFSQTLELLGTSTTPYLLEKHHSKPKAIQKVPRVHEESLCSLTDREANRDGLPDLMLTSKEIISGDVKIKGSLVYTEVPWGGEVQDPEGRLKSRLTSQDFRRVYFGLSLSRPDWKKSIELSPGWKKKRRLKNCLMFKNHLCQAQVPSEQIQSQPNMQEGLNEWTRSF